MSEDKEDKIPEDIRKDCQELTALLNKLHLRSLEACGLPLETVPNNLQLQWLSEMNDDDLCEQLWTNCLEHVSSIDAIQTGAVYCFLCKSASCAHAKPETISDVFAGYNNNGSPIWQEFLSLLLELEDDRVDQVVGNNGRLIGKVMSRKRLIDKQFIGSGRNSLTYRIIGQMIAGYFRVNEQQCAITIQIVENASRILHLQIIAPAAMQEMLADSEEKSTGVFARLYHTLHELKHELHSMNSKWKQADQQERGQLREKIFSELRHLGNMIERKGRQSKRRTQHAQNRQNENRPIANAMDDLSNAADHHFYSDKARGSIVVAGKRGRAHVFNPEGKHVTSLILPSDKLEKREQRKRYIHLNKDEREKFKDAVKEHYGKEV